MRFCCKFQSGNGGRLGAPATTRGNRYSCPAITPGPVQTVIRLFSVLRLSRFSRSLKGMEVHFSPDVETQLQQVASANGKNAEQLVKDTVARMLESQVRFVAEVQRGIAQADRGEFVEHKDVLNRIDRLFHS